MIEEIAEVVSIEINSVTVAVIRQSVCGNCSAQNACGHQLLNKCHSKRQHTLSVPLTDQCLGTLKIGDKIRIGVQDDAVIKASLLVYGCPLVGLLLGMLLFRPWMASELGAIFGLIGGFLTVKQISQKWRLAKFNKNRTCYQPVFLGVLTRNHDNSVMNFLP